MTTAAELRTMLIEATEQDVDEWFLDWCLPEVFWDIAEYYAKSDDDMDTTIGHACRAALDARAEVVE